MYENEERFLKGGTQEIELSLFTMKLKSSVKQIGIKGGSFFTITFSLLGTVDLNSI